MTKLVWGEGNKPPVVGGTDDTFAKIDSIVSDSKDSVTQWANKQQKYHRLRMRIKKIKNFPFKNSSNIRMPTAETNIRKIKSGIMRQVFGIRPVVSALPSPTGNRQVADKIEKFMDHLIMDVMGIEEKAEIGIDQSLEKGFYIAKPFWRFECLPRVEDVDLKEMPIDEVMAIFSLPKEVIVREVIAKYEIDTDPKVYDENILAVEKAIDEILSGKDKVTMKFKDVVYDFPDVDFISPERCYVPSDTGFDPQKASSVTVEFFLPLQYIRDNAEYKGWDADVINKLSSFVGVNQDTMTDTEKDFREGVERLNSSGLVRVWETYGYFDLGEGVKKAVVTSFPDFHSVARKVLLDTFSGNYPLVKLYYELIDDRWFSHRGVCEMLEDIIKEIDVQHNMKIDSQTLRNGPILVYRAGLVNPNLVQVNPAQGIPVNGLQPLDDTIKAINLHNPNAEFSYEREQMILETKIQEIVGQVDFSVQSLINRRQPRTLGEVDQQVNQASQSFSLDVTHYIRSFSKLFEMIFEMWCQYGKDSYEFNYFGDSLEGESIKLSREEVQGKYRIVVRGNDQNTNPQIKMQKAQQILMAVTNPLLIQTGIVNPTNIANGLKRFFRALDIDGVEEFINVEPQPPQSDPRTNIEPKFRDLTDSEKAQVLASYGVQADGVGRQNRQFTDAVELAADVASKVGS